MRFKSVQRASSIDSLEQNESQLLKIFDLLVVVINGLIQMKRFV